MKIIIRMVVLVFFTAQLLGCPPINEPPVPDNAEFLTTMNTDVSGTVTGSDPDSDELTFALAGAGSKGSAVMAADGSFTYTPNQGVKGVEDTLTFIIDDGKKKSDPASITITIAEEGTITGVVRDASTNSPLQSVSVSVSWKGTQEKQVLTDEFGVYSLDLPGAQGHTLSLTLAGYINGTIDNVEVFENSTTPIETLLYIQTQFDGEGTASGTISNAISGAAEGGVSLNLRAGVNVHAGTIAGTVTTDTLGSYTITLPGGNYTAELSKEGFITAYLTVVVLGGETRSSQNGTISPALQEGETRVVLTWGATPSDLDAHMTGPVTGSSTRFHIYFSGRGSATASPFTFLDVDDTSQFGPETITVSQQADGTYRYYVNDYTNSGSFGSTALANSGAKVTVTQGSRTLATYNVPNLAGTVWTVFELNGSTITSVNTMSDNSSVIQKVGVGGSSDVDLFTDLPEKQ